MSREGAILSISSKIGCAPQTLNEWIKKAEVDRGDRTGIMTKMAEKMKALERDIRELKQANEILPRAGHPKSRHKSRHGCLLPVGQEMRLNFWIVQRCATGLRFRKTGKMRALLRSRP